MSWVYESNQIKKTLGYQCWSGTWFGKTIKKIIRSSLSKPLETQTGYFFTADRIFDLIMEPIEKLPVDQRIKIIQYAYRRFNKALEIQADKANVRQ